MSNTKYSFQNINIIECIEKSFSEFLENNQIKYPFLSNKNMEKWNFEEYLDKKNILPLDLKKEPALIDLVPNIEISNNKELKLVKFYGTIQNVFENQIYTSAKYDSTNKKYIVNKYFENHSKIIKLEEDDILGDRLRLELVPVFGLNEYFGIKYNNEAFNKQKIIVYDYTNKFTKINQNILVLGVSYIRNDIIFIHSWKIIGNYEEIKISKYLELYPEISEQKHLIREKIKRIFLKIFKNDELASDYLLLFLFSQIFSRVSTKNVGIFPLNIILDSNNDINQCNDVYTNALNTLKKICLKIKDIKLSIDNLNNSKFYPRFDSETEELYPGELQLSDGTFLLIDEISMNEGKLVEIGIKNLGALKGLIDFQLLGYEYPYNKIEISHDVEILIFTHKTKSILHSPFLTLLPTVFTNDNINSDIINENDFKIIFYYLNYIRYDSSFKDEFIIKEEISNSIQKNYVDNNHNFKADDFDLVFKLSKFHALSHGRNYLTYDDYEYVDFLEKKRKQRLNDYTKTKTKK